MKNRYFSFVILLIACLQTAYSQTSISGVITPSKNFATMFYVFKINNIDLHAPILYDSIAIKSDGTFSYKFKNTSPQDLIYRILIPVREGSRFHTYGTVNKNFFYITTEGNEEIKVTA